MPDIAVCALPHFGHYFRVHVVNPAAYFVSLELVYRITRRDLASKVRCLYIEACWPITTTKDTLAQVTLG
jgi:hypothetical protein